VELVTTAIVGWGSALPEGTLDNAELAPRLGVSEEWIVQRTGIHSRHIAAPADTASGLAVRAGGAALRRAGVAPDDIDLVIVATATPDYQLPATASLVQAQLGCTRAGAFDLNAGCAGFLYGLAQARNAIESGACERVLVCGADILSRVTDYTDARSCVLFGDGAGAVVLAGSAGAIDLGPFVLRSDGSDPELLWIPRADGVIHMRGREVFRRAVDAMSSSLAEVLSKARITSADVDLIVFHQANARIVEAIVARAGLDPDAVMVNIGSVGNTSAASIPLALAEAGDGGQLHDGATVAIAAFGAGFAWGAGLVRWAPGRPSEPAVAPELAGAAQR
jgi:3-oxoacyl-[acyl-carrier-protein] synthase-3